MATRKTGTGTSPRPFRRGRGFFALGLDVQRLTKPLFGQRGFAAAEVVTDWPEIVGPEIARDSLPEKVQFPKGKRAGGTLYLRVRPGGAATHLQHMAPQVLERVNAYFGFAAVTQLKLVQAPLPPGRAAPAPGRPSGKQAPPAKKNLEDALDSLGRHVAERESERKPPVDKGRG